MTPPGSDRDYVVESVVLASCSVVVFVASRENDDKRRPDRGACSGGSRMAMKHATPSGRQNAMLN
jgi:hypothetical protein